MATVTLKGPIFDARGDAAVRDLKHDAVESVAGQGLADVHQNLDHSTRHPTPYYETQIAVDVDGDNAVVHDRGVIYGPWLEGVGSRNKTTRFKGYASFRRAAQGLGEKVPRLVEHAVKRAVGRLNG